MPNIHILSEEVISKIAAGEIIERPASIVKELLENSIDSGADNIIIETENGGKKKIKVIDNGCGMSRDDVSICIERHATSKIKNINDLKKISSLGFRGEALTSILAASGDLEIITKDKNSDFGTSLKAKSGQKKSISEVGASLGTTVIVKDLFFNVPARLKFLKSTFTELGHISEIVFKESLVYTDISFKLIHNDQIIYNVLKEDNSKNRVVLYYGKETDEELISVTPEFADNLIKISGLISKPTLTKPNRSYQSIFVNKRPVFDRIIANAISYAYDTLLSKDRFPLVVLFIDINPELVDVNVHPTKREVRFVKADEVHKNVVNAIKQTLEKNNIIKKYTAAFIEVPSPKQSNYDTDITSRVSEVKEAIQEYLTPANPASETLDKKQLLQVNNTFIILETKRDEKGVYIIDQHAAHERIIYEEIISKKSSLLESQGLLLPVNLNLTAKESNALEENINFFEDSGFEMANLGKFTFSILAVPEILADKDFAGIVKDILSDLSNEKLSDKIYAKDKIIKTIACRSAVMANDKLKLEQMELIANKIEKCKLPYCPHGRPAIVFLGLPEINKMFKRSTMSL